MTDTPTQKQITEFLLESNRIENVRDERSLIQAELAFDYLMEQDVLDVPIILETHRILMKNQRIAARYKGAFRDVPVYIGGREGTKPELLEHCITQWLVFTNEAAHDSRFGMDDALSRKLHIEYERIHPFIDGNGRTGRMFMNWTRLRKLHLPLLIIHEGEEQMDYYRWFD